VGYHEAIGFAKQTLRDTAVTVFDSSRVPEPFLDSVLLEKIRKRQGKESAKGGET
jgi:hypothetical protein